MWIVTLLLNRGWSARAAKVGGWLIAGLVACVVIGLLVMAFRQRDTRIADTAVQLDRSDITMEVANRMEAATTAATVNQQARDDASAEDQKELQHEVDTKGTAEPVGPATAGVLARMRQQQAAGRR